MAALEEDMRDLHLSIDSRFNESSQHPSAFDSSDMLNLSRQRLNHIPDYVLKCATVKNLYLEGNEVSSLPKHLFINLPHLVWLDVRNNQLDCLPAEIGQHRCLKTLLLEGNPITVLPLELGNLITLRALSLRNCPITFPPQDVLQLGLPHILQFLRRTAMAQRPVSAHGIQNAAPDMPAVEKLPLSEMLQSSLDLSEVDDTEVQRFRELRQRMIQMERADLEANSPVILESRHFRAAEGARSPITHYSSVTKRTQELMTGRLPELGPFDVQCRRRSNERQLPAMRTLQEKQTLLEQRRKDAEVLQQWRNQAKIMQERKLLEYKQNRGKRQQKDEDLRNGADTTGNAHGIDGSNTEDQHTPQRSGRDTEEARVARDRELEQRIRTRVQMMQERRRKPRGSPREEAKAAAQEIEEVKRLQMELAERKYERDLEYRFTAFTGGSDSDNN
ncbi:leucine-rich repeat-containing protein 27-like [Trichomycterus rosablanca]|uniref:leucine-rich repeat-containing protein 27-like n=1 Tax=Trichomycterus rosablanca TaxID=2290929 RepID=UPI002F35DC97